MFSLKYGNSNVIIMCVRPLHEGYRVMYPPWKKALYPLQDISPSTFVFLVHDGCFVDKMLHLLFLPAVLLYICVF